MKSINARMTWLMFFPFRGLLRWRWLGRSTAGSITYTKISAASWLSRTNAPPPGSKILKRETLSEVTGQQIAESQIRRTAGFDNRLSSLENTISELSNNLRVQGEAIDNLQQGHDSPTSP